MKNTTVMFVLFLADIILLEFENEVGVVSARATVSVNTAEVSSDVCTSVIPC